MTSRAPVFVSDKRFRRLTSRATAIGATDHPVSCNCDLSFWNCLDRFNAVPTPVLNHPSEEGILVRGHRYGKVPSSVGVPAGRGGCGLSGGVPGTIMGSGLIELGSRLLAKPATIAAECLALARKFQQHRYLKYAKQELPFSPFYRSPPMVIVRRISSVLNPSVVGRMTPGKATTS